MIKCANTILSLCGWIRWSSQFNHVHLSLWGMNSQLNKYRLLVSAFRVWIFAGFISLLWYIDYYLILTQIHMGSVVKSSNFEEVSLDIFAFFMTFQDLNQKKWGSIYKIIKSSVKLSDKLQSVDEEVDHLNETLSA